MLEIIAAAIGGGAITKTLDFFLGRRKENRGDFEAIINRWSEDNERLRIREKELLERVIELERQVTILQNSIELMQKSN